MGQRFISSDAEHQISEDWETLHAPGAETATAASALRGSLPENCRGVLACLDVTAAGTLVGDTLDVYIRTLIHSPAGDRWENVIHFTQVLGNGGPLRHYDKIVADLDQATFEEGTPLAAGGKRHLIGSQWRCVWTIADGGGTHTFNFSVNLQPL